LEILKNLEGEVNPKSEEKLKEVTKVAEKAALAAESKVNQLEEKSTEARNQALEMKKIAESAGVDLELKKKDDAYKE
jgi:hypothetical protein